MRIRTKTHLTPLLISGTELFLFQELLVFLIRDSGIPTPKPHLGCFKGLIHFFSASAVKLYHVLLLMISSSCALVIFPSSGCCSNHLRKSSLISSGHWLSIWPVV